VLVHCSKECLFLSLVRFRVCSSSSAHDNNSNWFEQHLSNLLEVILQSQGLELRKNCQM
jgi:hypothetical protein